LLDALATHVMQEVVLLAEDLDSCLCADNRVYAGASASHLAGAD